MGIKNKRKILLITGILCYDDALRISEKINSQTHLLYETEVIKCDVEIASFISPDDIKVAIMKNKINLTEYRLGLISGFIPWDTAKISEEIGLLIYKGTRFISDLYELFLNFEDIELSTKKAADQVLSSFSDNNYQNIIDDLYQHYPYFDKISGINFKTLGNGEILKFKRSRHQVLKKDNIKNETDQHGQKNNKNIADKEYIYCGWPFPPLIFAEVVNAPKIKKDSLFSKIKHYISSGADVIDIGTIINRDNTKYIREIIPEIKSNFNNILVSIDTINIEEIIAGIEAGADIILSIDGENIKSFIKYVDKLINENNLELPNNNRYSNHKDIFDLGIVLIPLYGEKHVPLHDAADQSILLFQLALKLTKMGFHNIFYDMLLRNPINPGIMPSIQNFWMMHNILYLNNNNNTNTSKENYHNYYLEYFMKKLDRYLNNFNDHLNNPDFILYPELLSDIYSLLNADSRSVGNNNSNAHLHNISNPNKKLLNPSNTLKYPFFIGINNIFELIDADSPGIIALIIHEFMELNLAGILTTEYSPKSYGAVDETYNALKLSYLAKFRNVPPINLGLNAFYAKNKYKSLNYNEDYNNTILIQLNDPNNPEDLNITLIDLNLKNSHHSNILEKKKGTVPVIDGEKITNNDQIIKGALLNFLKKPAELKMDPLGYFKIFLNTELKVIELIFFPKSPSLPIYKKIANIIKEIENVHMVENEFIDSMPKIVIRGKNAGTIYKTLLKLGLVSELSHAFYLGKELGRAEKSLYIHGAFIEDSD